MALVEYDFPVLYRCGHADVACGPDEVYELQVLERSLHIPCFVCEQLESALAALKRGDVQAADAPLAMFAEGALSYGYVQPLIEALETVQRGIQSASA